MSENPGITNLGSPVAEGEASLRRATLKLLLLIAVTALCLGIVYLTPLRDWLRDVQSLKRQLKDAGLWAPAIFAGGTALLVAVGCPRLLCSAVGGMVFGFGEGLALSLAGSMAGSYGTFLFARWSGREWVQRTLSRFPARGRLMATLAQPSVAAVFWARQLPVTGVFTSLLLGLTPVRQRVFLLGSTLGFLPTAAIVSLAGSGVGKGSAWASFGQIGGAAAGVLAVVWGLGWVHRRWQHGL